MRMYHPDLGRETDVPDDEACIAVHTEGGWLPAPEPEAVAGQAPEPVRYEPVKPDKPKKAATKAAATNTEPGDGAEEDQK